MLAPIKLYAKERYSWRSETREKAEQEIKKFMAQKVKHEIQRATWQITIQQIINDNKYNKK